MPTLKLYANLRDLAGTKELLVSGESVREILGDAMRIAPALRSMILGEGEPGSNLVLVLNGFNVIDLDTPVAEHDSLAAFPPIAGG